MVIKIIPPLGLKYSDFEIDEMIQNEEALIDSPSEKIMLLAEEITRLNSLVNDSYAERDEWKERALDLENKIDMLINENQRLNLVIDEGSQQIESWRNKYHELRTTEWLHQLEILHISVVQCSNE